MWKRILLAAALVLIPARGLSIPRCCETVTGSDCCGPAKGCPLAPGGECQLIAASTHEGVPSDPLHLSLPTLTPSETPVSAAGTPVLHIPATDDPPRHPPPELANVMLRL